MGPLGTQPVLNTLGLPVHVGLGWDGDPSSASRFGGTVQDGGGVQGPVDLGQLLVVGAIGHHCPDQVAEPTGWESGWVDAGPSEGAVEGWPFGERPLAELDDGSVGRPT
jgi:hypothetical protein